MSHNLLLDLPRSGFIGMETLESLDLSHNDLRIVDKRAFESMLWLSDLQVRTLTQYFILSNTIDLPGVQINEPPVRRIRFSFVPPSHSLVAVSDP